MGVAERDGDALICLEGTPSGVSRCRVTGQWPRTTPPAGRRSDPRPGAQRSRGAARCPRSSISFLSGARSPQANCQFGSCQHAIRLLQPRRVQREKPRGLRHGAQHSIAGRENGHRQTRRRHRVLLAGRGTSVGERTVRRLEVFVCVVSSPRLQDDCPVRRLESHQLTMMRSTAMTWSVEYSILLFTLRFNLAYNGTARSAGNSATHLPSRRT